MSDQPDPESIERLEALAKSNFAVPPDADDARVTAFLCRFYRLSVDPGFAKAVADEAVKEFNGNYVSGEVETLGNALTSAKKTQRCIHCRNLRDRHHALTLRCPMIASRQYPVMEFARTYWEPAP